MDTKWLERPPMTMSSLEIAELCEKRHDHVLRDIGKHLKDIGEDLPEFGEIYQDSYGREQRCYHLTKRLSFAIVAKYMPKFLQRIIDRWFQLEDDGPKGTDVYEAIAIMCREAIGPLGANVVTLQTDMKEVKTDLSDVKRDLAEVKSWGPRRKYFSKPTQGEYLETAKFRGQMCPLYPNEPLFSGNRFIGEFDHMNGRHRKGIRDGWAISKRANDDFESGKLDREQYRALFNDWHRTRLMAHPQLSLGLESAQA